jgi:hypothetical protein
MRYSTPLLWISAACASVAAGAVVLAAASGSPNPWWQAGEPRIMPSQVSYEDGSGRVTILHEGGAFQTQGHAFFTPIGSNGRACITCHQPSDGMSLSVDTIRRRWDETGGKDPLFAAIDGSNCPSLPQDERASHSLLLDRGLIRVYLPWPPHAAGSAPLKPEFSIEVVSDPTGCNNDPVYGLHSRTPSISVFRRPRPVANLKYLLELPHGVPPADFLFYNDKTLLPRNPETGGFVTLQLMSDGRDLTLQLQARDAAGMHLQELRLRRGLGEQSNAGDFGIVRTPRAGLLVFDPDPARSARKYVLRARRAFGEHRGGHGGRLYPRSHGVR